MGKELKILAVCGFGVGSSMILKMKIDEVLKENNIKADVFTTDVGTATSTPCDVIFTSSELGETFKGKVSVPVVVINNFINKKEIEEKGLSVIKELL
ncbi:PTS system IIB component, L-Asc family [Anaerobranca californiensis DSM 14826]|jgi:PTS system ascorbate-specific IIB component|uniref:PTS system IIB component, L-Asc family n=1 Tax=Anaerobranca californiensis DSM 14826 TaxID=1120989 RepID=A0A1M6RAH5_9FIRM|nr:PTS sugar transporter subunit IIB [Anaerobranca californiensis]SHK29317.1 PTS system IIB component, L-Asc family [Anaerobranca californiensis DSM 14826]